ncbi:alpha/beta hydrolase [Mycoplana rhizolycopersici]|uniref:Alpha/beta hydrolase n=1 Tax=Mycoplana rhizolycopersici TaxID=2746702 RepID=A0ABX2QDT3_9HYPH|nr:alpha/beta hydrolase [Rhizobium rhizolycopersici]NVP55882.1 alpha/beta hydrolase [Rhizobium rhizolycopersici]
MPQSTIHCRNTRLLRGARLVLAAIVVSALPAVPAAAASLAPWKDELFAYPAVIESSDGGAMRVVDYQEMRDINGRDQVPERRAKAAYVSTAVKRDLENLTISTPRGSVDVAATGKQQGANFTVIFIHGRGGDRRLGNNDWSFGGNFNRLKNLAVHNGGVYYSASVKSFDDKGAAPIAGLIEEARRNSPGAPVVLSCASMGSFICWQIARDPEAVRNLAGMILMGGAPDPNYIESAAYKAKMPIYFTHGESDKVYKAQDQVAQFRKLLKAGVPTQFVLFRTGSHGTPVRMTDWRETLNWIFAH